MIYTLGHKKNYELYFAEQGTPQKLGRTEDYQGGSVWQHRHEAETECLRHPGYAVYGVLADWEKDTAKSWSEGATWRDLLTTSNLVKLSKERK